MRYFEVEGIGHLLERGFCSDQNCPCAETVIPSGTGYLYISQEVVDFRRDALSRKAAERKAQKMTKRMRERFGSPIVLIGGSSNPVLVCEEGAMLRNLDLEIAAADARTWWETGTAPLRATPLAGSEAARKARETLRSDAKPKGKRWWQFWI